MLLSRVRKANEMTLETEEDVKRELRRLLGGAPDATLWEHAVDEGWVQDAIDYHDDEDGVLTLSYKYQEAEHLASKLLSDSDKPPRVPRRRSSPPTYALDALSEIMAIEAQSHPLVVAFRERVLGGRRLQSSEAAAWMRDHECHLWLPERWPPAWAHQMIQAARIERYATVGDFDVPENEVDFMVCVIDMLRDTYGWPDPLEVAGFVLCGETPPLPSAIAYVQPYGRFWPKNAKVCLEVSPQMEPLQLMKLFASMRHAGMKPKSRIRPPGEAASFLAVFVARHNDGSTWHEAWRAWNAEGGRKYAEERSFTRDARKAYRMVTGKDLDWTGGASANRKEQS